MKRTAAVLACILALWPALSLRAGTAPGAPAGDSREKPNFIIIYTDDLDVSGVDFMPRVKRLLAAHGATFTNYFVSEAVCCPSRSSLLRGQYAHNHGVLNNHEPEGGFKKFYEMRNEQSTLATWLHSAGYRTVLLGKYLNGYVGKKPGAPEGLINRAEEYIVNRNLYVPPGWDEWYATLNHHARYFDYQLNENHREVAYGHAPGDYETDVLAAKTIDFIQRTAGKQPFFIYLAPAAPHTPATPAPRHSDEFPDARAPRTASFDEKDVSLKPAWVRNTPPLTKENIARIDKLYRKRLQTMLAVDEMVEKILAALEARGELDRTYIFFSSDNGFHLGQHRQDLGKATAYEEDIRVPLIVRGPGIVAGKKLAQLALNIDLAPTIADLAGVTPPDFVDGRSLKTLLLARGSPPVLWRRDFLVEFWAHPPRRGEIQPGYSGLRTTDHMYVEYSTGERELYNLRSDPDELKNLIASTDEETLSRLSKRLADLKQCAGAACRRDTETFTKFAPRRSHAS